MTVPKKKFGKIFKEVAAYVTSGVIGAGVACTGYEIAFKGYEEVKTPHAEVVKTGFQQRLAVIADMQKDLAPTDDEGLAVALETKKAKFVTDVIMNKELGERDVVALATRFNAIPSEDDIRFRFLEVSLQSGAYRNECMAEVDDTLPAAKAAELVQDCMIGMSETRIKMQGVLGVGGLLAGMGVYGATTPLRRKIEEKAAKKKKAAHGHASHKPHHPHH